MILGAKFLKLLFVTASIRVATDAAKMLWIPRRAASLPVCAPMHAFLGILSSTGPALSQNVRVQQRHKRGDTDNKGVPSVTFKKKRKGKKSNRPANIKVHQRESETEGHSVNIQGRIKLKCLHLSVSCSISHFVPPWLSLFYDSNTLKRFWCNF